ncbi:MAG: response regulator [Spirochaetales bacterium]|nr:response regulator [Spirochaetales bacterium]
MTVKRISIFHKQFRFIYIFIGILFIVLIANCSTAIDVPFIEDGILDFKNQTIDDTSILDLRGKWKFYWGIEESSFSNLEENVQHGEYLFVPGSWKDSIKGNSLGHGYGWYYLTLRNVGIKNPALYLMSYNTAMTLYVNGNKQGMIGIPAPQSEFSVAGVGTLLISLPDTHEFTVAIFASNFDDINGGLNISPWIGNVELIASELKKDTAYTAFTLGIIFIMVIFHIILWIMRRSDKTSLFFAGFCLMIFLRFFMHHYYALELFSPLNISPFYFRALYLSINLSTLFLILYLTELFPREFKNKYFHVLKISLVSLSVLLLFPPSVFTSQLIIFPMSVMIGGVSALISLMGAVHEKRDWARFVSIGFLIIFLAALNDLIAAFLVEYNFGIIQYALIVFLFLQSYMLGRRFRKAYDTAYHLSNHLQQEVLLQTRQIEAQKDELIKINQERTNFFINFSHETKTPVTLIYNYLEEYIRKKGSSIELDVLRKNVLRLKNDMTNFLDMEKMIMGKTFYNHDQISDFSALLNSAIKLFRPTMENAGLFPEVEIDDFIYVKIDPSALSRIVNNLIENAVKYTSPGKAIRITLRKSNKDCLFAVGNHGALIPESEWNNIFKPFYQIGQKKSNQQGMGMGLAIVKMVIDQTGGSVKVQSSFEKGTLFTIQLPLYAGPIEENQLNRDLFGTESIVFNSKVINEVNAIVEIEYDPEKKNLLIVEDNEDMLSFLCHSLSSDYNIFYGRNGQDALCKFEGFEKLPDLIISDIMMDVMDGYEFLKNIQNSSELRSIPFIFLTAKTAIGEKLQGLEKGAIDYIQKPFDILELKAKIAAVLNHNDILSDENKKNFMNRLSEYVSGNNQFSHKNRFLELGLTLRECDVAKLLMKGKQNKEMAFELALAESSIKKHVNNIYTKCGVNRKIDFIKMIQGGSEKE